MPACPGHNGTACLPLFTSLLILLAGLDRQGRGYGIGPDRHEAIMAPVGILLQVLAAGGHGDGAVIILHQLAPGEGLGRTGFHGDGCLMIGDLGLHAAVIQPDAIGEHAGQQDG